MFEVQPYITLGKTSVKQINSSQAPPLGKSERAQTGVP